MGLKELITRMVLLLIKKQVRSGKATNIDKDKCLCDVDLGDGLMLYKVSLKATESGEEKGLVIFPKDNSYVLVTMVEGIDTRYAVSHYSEIDSWGIYTESGKIEVKKDSGEVHLNGDSKGAMVVIQSLVDKINQLENSHNQLVSTYNAHKHPINNSPVDSVSTAVINPKTTVNDLKNDKVKHGS